MEEGNMHPEGEQLKADAYDIMQTKPMNLDQVMATSANYFKEALREKAAYIESLNASIPKERDWGYRNGLQEELESERIAFAKIEEISNFSHIRPSAAFAGAQYWKEEYNAMVKRFDRASQEGRSNPEFDHIRSVMQENVRLLEVAAYMVYSTTELKNRIESGEILWEDSEIAVEAYIRALIKEYSRDFELEYHKPVTELKREELSIHNPRDRERFNRVQGYIADLNDGLPGFLRFAEEWKNSLSPVTGKPVHLDTIIDKIRSEIVR